MYTIVKILGKGKLETENNGYRYQEHHSTDDVNRFWNWDVKPVDRLPILYFDKEFSKILIMSLSGTTFKKNTLII